MSRLTIGDLSLRSDEGFLRAVREASNKIPLGRMHEAIASAVETAVASCWFSVCAGDTALWRVNKATSDANVVARTEVIARLRAIADESANAF